jgi:hypothetical protein
MMEDDLLQWLCKKNDEELSTRHLQKHILFIEARSGLRNRSFLQIERQKSREVSGLLEERVHLNNVDIIMRSKPFGLNACTKGIHITLSRALENC